MSCWPSRESSIELVLRDGLTAEDGRCRMLSGDGAVLLITVVSAVVELITDLRAHVQTSAVGAQESALWGHTHTRTNTRKPQ